MVNITFANQDYLWLLALVPFLIVIHFFTLKKSRADAIRFSNFEAIQRVSKGDFLGTGKRFMSSKNFGLLSLRTFVYLLLIFSVAGTFISYRGNAAISDYVLAIDTSSSMLADDFYPNRLAAAKNSAAEFITYVPADSKVGIVTFAGTSIVNLRPSSSRLRINQSISKIEPQETGGTGIGDAIITATNIFDKRRIPTIILLTDGQSNVGIDMDTALEYAKDNNVRIHTIGVATNEGGNVAMLNLISKLDDQTLRVIANETDGYYYWADDINALNQAFRNISLVTNRIILKDISWMLLLGAISLLAFEWILINTIYKTIP